MLLLLPSPQVGLELLLAAAANAAALEAAAAAATAATAEGDPTDEPPAPYSESENPYCPQT